MKKKKDQDTELFLAQLELENPLELEKNSGLAAETEMDYMIQRLSHYPLFSESEEKDLTWKIFEGKIAILTNLAVSEPIFTDYLDIMISCSDSVSQEDSDDSVEDDDDEPVASRYFTRYLNAEKDDLGKEREFIDFKKKILELKTLCLEIQTIVNPPEWESKRLQITELLTEISFSWSQLKKDKLFDLVEKDDSTWLALRKNIDKMVYHNMRLSISIAKKYFLFDKHHADLIQEANRGLMTAVDRFDPRKGFRFSTYAIRWIKQMVQRRHSQFWTIRVPVHLADKITALKTLERKNPEWSESQIVKHFGYTAEYLDKLRLINRQTNVISLDEPVNNDPSKDGSDTIGTFTSDPNNNLEKTILEVITHDEIVKLMKAKLTPREYDIMSRRLGLEDRDEETLEVIGGFFKLSRERIRQIEQAAIKKLRGLKYFQQLQIVK